MKIRSLIPIFIFVILLSCKPSPEAGRVDFSIKNECFNDIHVAFVNIETADSDYVTIIRHETFTIYDFVLSPYKHTNWFTDYDVHINNITNFAGDTINFDPNYPTNWTMSENELFANYQLQLNESDF
jgi:hypothetical protein